MKKSRFRRWSVCLSLGVLLSSPARAQVGGPGNALDLDGAGGYAQAPNGVWFNGNFTVEGWVYVRSYNSWSRLIDFANGPGTNNVYVALSAGNSGLPAMGVFTNSTGIPVLQAANQPTNQLPLNQWTHLAATLNGTTGAIYINGNLVANGTLNLPQNIVRTNNYIGRSNYSQDGLANALFDEVRIWNVARTRGQIAANMRRSLVGNEAGLIGYWRMDDASAGTLIDSSAQGQTATVFGATRTNSTVPMVAGAGSALNFNAGIGQLVTIPHQPALNAYPLTVMTWFRSPTTNANGALINKYNSASLNGYQLFMTGGRLQGWYIRDAGNNVFNGGPLDAGLVNDGFWHHAAMTVDAAGGRLYLDGVLKSTLPWTGTAGPVTTNLPISLGIYQGNSFWSGQLDEVSIWNTALSTTQIQSAMNRPLAGTEAGLLGYWRLDEGSGTNTVDATTNGYHGTLGGNPTWVNSSARLVVPNPGYALSLNGTNAYLQVTNGVWFTNAFTVEGWVYARAYNNWSRLLDFGNGEYLHDIYLALSGGVGGYPTMGIFNNGGAPLVGSTNQLPLNQWAHLAATFDGTSGTIYIDGQLGGSGPMPVIPANVIRTNNYLGRSAFGGDAYANALFDEIRIWNVARSQLQIQQHMNRPLAGGETNLIGYWRLDEGVGTNSLDGTGRGNNVNLINGPAWKISSALANGAPILAPLPATNITAASAILRAMVKPNGSPTAVYFAYGTNQAYGFTNVIPNIGNGFDPILVTNTISGLLDGLVYHFQVSASNSFGFAANADQTLVAIDPPDVVTLAATAIATTNATLNGSLAPNGGNATAWFQYGLTTNYGSVTPSTVVAGTNLTMVPIANVISNLYPGIPYHFRLVGSNLSSTVLGADLTFTPPAAAPEMNGAAAVSITLTGAVLSALVRVNGADTTVWCQYGLTTNYGSSTASTNISGTNLAAVPIGSLVSGLSPGMIYHARLLATNVAGTASSADLTFATAAFAQSGTTLPSVFHGSSAWGDFNNDGLLDVLISGATHPSGNNPITHVWRNTGNGFSIYWALPGLSRSSVAWGDYDNDGLLDLLIAGYDSGFTRVTQLWRNTGGGFEFINSGLPGIAYGSVAWGDYDNDGRLDVLLGGIGPGGLIAQVWRNTVNGFANINAGLPGLDRASVAWGDYDNDGRLDILLAGVSPGQGAICQVWRNTGNGFTNINAGLSRASFGSAAWGDYDNDGLLDILLLGGSTEIWRNTGDGFANINAGLPGLTQGCAAWGDFNADGKLDIVISGVDLNYIPHTQVWLNTDSGFVKNPDLPGLYYTAAAFADYDNDGRLDLLISGLPQNAINFSTQLWRNQTAPTNSRPTAPSNLSAAPFRSSLTLSWNAASDVQTATAGLSYNLRVGTTPGGSDILGPMADASGTRRLPKRGGIQSMQKRLELPASVLPGTVLYWSVQSIDPSFAGSAFAAESSVLIRPYFTSSGRRSDGAFQAQFDVLAGTNYTIEASSDLVHWLGLFDFNFGSSGPVLFTDPSATNYPRRFYRFGQY